MAARTPRRTFATPFVVTLSACYTQPPPPQPPPQQPPAAQQPADPTPVVIANPPRPTDPPPQPPQIGAAPTTNPPPPQPSEPPPNPVDSSPITWTIYKQKTGDCYAAVKVDCPPKAMCNPPPPIKYACPENVSLDTAKTVIQIGNSCHVDHGPMSCPPNRRCNPPPPQNVPCPKR